MLRDCNSAKPEFCACVNIGYDYVIPTAHTEFEGFEETGCPWEESVAAWEESADDWRRIYSVVLRNRGMTPAGIILAERCGRIFMTEVASGSIEPWNDMYKDARCFAEEGDELLAVNGTTGDMFHCLRELNRRGTVTITLQKPHRHTIEIDKEGEETCTIGLELTNMFISDIDPDGLVRKWLNAHPEVQIEPNDFVVEVNGSRQKHLKEIELATANAVSMIICHYEKSTYECLWLCT